MTRFLFFMSELHENKHFFGFIIVCDIKVLAVITVDQGTNLQVPELELFSLTSQFRITVDVNSSTFVPATNAITCPR